MGLIEKLRKAEEQGKEAARHAFERAREIGEDAERRLRQKMRVYPPEAGSNGLGKAKAVGAGNHQRSSHESQESDVVPIVSVHGRDVEGGSDKAA
jgi:vacuolar-type H+-ATPase subunit H